VRFDRFSPFFFGFDSHGIRISTDHGPLFFFFFFALCSFKKNLFKITAFTYPKLKFKRHQCFQIIYIQKTNKKTKKTTLDIKNNKNNKKKKKMLERMMDDEKKNDDDDEKND
jgi:hypothetical protein